MPNQKSPSKHDNQSSERYISIVKKQVAILLTFLFISVGCRDLMTILYFYTNQSYIAQNICINKDKPEKMCKGKCFLAKQFEEERNEKSEDAPSPRLFDHFQLKVITTDDRPNDLDPPLQHVNIEWGLLAHSYNSGYYSSPFQPPELLV